MTAQLRILQMLSEHPSKSGPTNAVGCGYELKLKAGSTVRLGQSEEILMKSLLLETT